MLARNLMNTKFGGQPCETKSALVLVVCVLWSCSGIGDDDDHDDDDEDDVELKCGTPSTRLA